MTKFAAYDDVAIYAVGDTPEAAIAKAREDARDPEASYQTAPITDEFAVWINANGWNANQRSFEIGSHGYLRDTTQAPYSIGDGVESAVDEDHGKVLDIRDDGRVYVGWSSGVRTWTHPVDLR